MIGMQSLDVEANHHQILVSLSSFTIFSDKYQTKYLSHKILIALPLFKASAFTILLGLYYHVCLEEKGLCVSWSYPT